MKISTALIASVALGLAIGNTYSETVHQTAEGENAYTSGGENAAAKKLLEVKELPSGETVARLPASTSQWGFVNYWFGLPAPAGDATIRLGVYVDGEEPAPYALYIKRDNADPLVEKIEIPADAPKDGIVTIDIPVNLPQEWSGLALKKIAASDSPGPWIDSISVVLP